MLTGPKKEKRPADVIGNAVKVMRIATGEECDELPDDGKDPVCKGAGAQGWHGASGKSDAGAAQENRIAHR